MSDANKASAEAFAAADALLAESPIPIAFEYRELLRTVVAMAWLKGWSDSGHTALALMDRIHAELR